MSWLRRVGPSASWSVGELTVIHLTHTLCVSMIRCQIEISVSSSSYQVWLQRFGVTCSPTKFAIAQKSLLTYFRCAWFSVFYSNGGRLRIYESHIFVCGNKGLE